MKRWALLLIVILLCQVAVAEQIALTGRNLASNGEISLPMESTFVDSEGKVYLVTMRESGPDLVLLMDDNVVLAEPEPAPLVYTPTVIEGRVVDSKNKPVGGTLVSAEWADSTGKRYRVETTSLTREEAVARGNTALIGSYAFSNNKLTVPPNQPIRITAGESVQIVNSLPGGKRHAKDSVVEQGEYEGGIVFAINPDGFVEWLREKWRGVIILVVAALLIVGVVAIFRSSGGQETSLSYRIKRFKSAKANQVIDQHPLTVSKSLTLKNVVGKFLTQGLSFALVMDGEKLVGVLTDKDIITKINHSKQDMAATTVGKIVSGSVRAVRPETSLESLISIVIENHLRVIPVTKKDKLLGAITRIQLMNELDRFFSLNRTTPTHIARVENIMDEPLTITEDTSVAKAIEMMKQRRVSSAIVVKKRNNKEEILGILSKREILEELYNYQSSLEKIKVNSIMQKKTKSINPGASLLEVNKIMIESGHRLLPVTLGDELVGIVTQSVVLRELWNLFGEIQELESMKGWKK